MRTATSTDGHPSGEILLELSFCDAHMISDFLDVDIQDVD